MVFLIWFNDMMVIGEESIHFPSIVLFLTGNYLPSLINVLANSEI